MSRYDHLDKSMVLERVGNLIYRIRLRGPNGRGLCRKCGKEVPPGRQSYCSNQCYGAWLMMTDSAFVRRAVFKRDKGVCAACGLDTEALRLGEPKEPSWRLPEDERRVAMEAYRQACVAYHDDMKARGFGTEPHLWEADHIIAVADGGGECDLSNYQTLCCPCHRKKTAELVSRRAKDKRR